jgi:hypothetical protein
MVDRIDARISRVQGTFSSLPSERAQEIQERLRADAPKEQRTRTVRGSSLRGGRAIRIGAPIRNV